MLDVEQSSASRSFEDTAGFDFDLKAIIEGALFAAGKTLSIKQLQALFGEEAPPEAERIEAILIELEQEYEGRGVVLTRVASGYRFQANRSVGLWVSRLWEEKPARYSRALLETLALIAYRQPVTRGEIEDVRGVSVSSHIIKTLLEREWVRVVGHKEVPGRPAMYATTRAFLDYFNLSNLDELPSLPEIQALDPDAIAEDSADAEGAEAPEQLSLELDEVAKSSDEALSENNASQKSESEGLVKEKTEGAAEMVEEAEEAIAMQVSEPKSLFADQSTDSAGSDEDLSEESGHEGQESRADELVESQLEHGSDEEKSQEADFLIE